MTPDTSRKAQVCHHLCIAVLLCQLVSVFLISEGEARHVFKWLRERERERERERQRQRQRQRQGGERDRVWILWGGSKEVINFPLIFFYAIRSLVPVRHFRNISEHLFPWLVCGSFQWRHALLFTDRIVWDDRDKVICFKRSHWIHLGWWSTGSPKLHLFQLSQHSHVTNCRLIFSSAYFPWNTTLKYKMQLSEGSWDKILHSKSRTVFFEGRIFFWRFVSRSDTPKFRK